MRETGLWHPRLTQLVTAIGHTETLVLADPGLPVPAGVETIDLVWTRSEPRLLPVLREVLRELVVEHATIAAELGTGEWADELRDVLGNLSVKEIPHDDFKRSVRHARAVVRTGEDTPYSNVMLHAGTAF